MELAFTVPKRRFELIRLELEAVARDELRDILEAWPALDADHCGRLARYLREECDPAEGAGLLTALARRQAGDHPSKAAGIERQGLRLAELLEGYVGP
jgi:hypothetical protein